MDGDAGAFAGRIHAGHARRAKLVGFDAAHRVVRAGKNRNRLVDRVLAGRVEREFANLRQTFEDLFAPEVAHVEQHAAVDAAAFEDLGPLGARDDVARCEFALVRRVLEHEAFARGVEQVGAFAARALGHQHAVLFERGGMELHELHVHQRDAGFIGDAHAVGGRGVAVSRLEVHASGAAGCKDRGLGHDLLELAVAHVVSDDAGPDTVVDRKRGAEILFVDFDAEALELLPERVQNHEARDVGRIARARRTGAAERPLRDPPIRHAREDAAAMFEPNDLVRRIFAHRFDRVLVAEIIGALDRIEGVRLRRVFLAVA